MVPSRTEESLHSAAVPPAIHRSKRRGRWLLYWDPEDETFWRRTGARVARRNLMCAVFAEHVCYGVWTMWSALVLFLGPDYGLTPAQKFTLVSVPALVGAAARIPYTFAVTRFGGRNWTVVSAVVLMTPAILTALLLRPGVQYSTLLLLAAVAGIGGGNFASSMANINGFFPERRKGLALGLTAAGGNLGVAGVQLLALAVLALAGAGHPRLLVGIYLPLLILAATCAYLFMDNLTGQRTNRHAVSEACREPHTWVMSLLYLGTFGSFIGFCFAFGQVLLVQYPEQFDTPVKAAYLTFLGPLVGSLARPVGGRLADRFGGAVVTMWNFAAMACCALVVLAASVHGSLPLFIAAFMALFCTAGVGNGSTYTMIPAIFRRRADSEVADGGRPEPAKARARRRTSAVIGIAGAVGALGGVAVNLAFRESFLRQGDGNAAYLAFAVAYLAFATITWAVYLRPRPVPVAAATARPVPVAAAFAGYRAPTTIVYCACAGRHLCSTCA